MTEKEDFIVRNPYQPTELENEAIKCLERNGLNSKDWESQKKGIVSFKSNLRSYMYHQQETLCAFCRLHLSSACYTIPIEHIVYKKGHPQWMFLPQNLCVACQNCNTFKGKTEVLNNPNILLYPSRSSDFKIIHPLYDRYSDHIELVDGIIYRGKTSKGIFTINTCHLYRVDLVTERANQKMLSDGDNSNVIIAIIRLLKSSDNCVDEKNRLYEYIKLLFEKYKQKQKLN